MTFALSDGALAVFALKLDEEYNTTSGLVHEA
jgi:hypothetical protein